MFSFSRVPTSKTPKKTPLSDIGGPQALISMCNVFYNLCSKDTALDKFILDHSDPHGERLGYWLAEKMGDKPLWSESRPLGSRFLAHRRAWNSKKRPKTDQGKRFKLKDCRNWMRLLFWAARIEKLDQHKEFFQALIQTIEMYISIYEETASPYTKSSAQWSSKKKNIKEYTNNGCSMVDLVSTNATSSKT